VTELRRLLPLILFTLIVVDSCIAGATEPEIAAKGEYQKLCSVCHLPDGRGIPGVYPPLNEQLGHWAKEEEGRTYLVKIVTQGMGGTIVVDGQRFSGYMPGIAMRLDPASLAVLLNDVLLKFAPEVDVQPYTGREIERIRSIEVKNTRDFRPQASS
jgi:hypothetical protein